MLQDKSSIDLLLHNAGATQSINSVTEKQAKQDTGTHAWGHCSTQAVQLLHLPRIRETLLIISQS